MSHQTDENKIASLGYATFLGVILVVTGLVGQALVSNRHPAWLAMFSMD